MAVTRVSGVWSSKRLFTSCLPLLVAALSQLQFPGTELLLAFTPSAVRKMLGTLRPRGMESPNCGGDRVSL